LSQVSIGRIRIGIEKCLSILTEILKGTIQKPPHLPLDLVDGLSLPGEHHPTHLNGLADLLVHVARSKHTAQVTRFVAAA
jgi:hypothetical protein